MLLLIFAIIKVSTLFPFAIISYNGFQKGFTDFDYTDVIFSEFRSEQNFDDRIVIINSQKPDRTQIAKCIEKLNSYSPKAVGVDIIFEKLKDSTIDVRLATSIRQSDKIILADIYDLEKNNILPHLCSTYFCNKDNSGYVNFVAKEDHTIRFFSPFIESNGISQPAFTSKIVEVADNEAFAKLKKRHKPIEQINYRGSIDSYIQIEIEDFLDKDYNEVINNKIILIGYIGMDAWSESSVDKYHTPVNPKITLKTKPDMYGIVIHANVVSMILDGKYIHKIPDKMMYVIDFIVGLLLVLFMRSMFYTYNSGYWKIIRLYQFVMFLTLFLICTVVFYLYDIKIQVGIILATIVLSWDVVRIYSFIVLSKQGPYKPKPNQ